MNEFYRTFTLGPARALITERVEPVPDEPEEPGRRALAAVEPAAVLVRVHQVHGERLYHAAGPTVEPYPRADAVAVERPLLAAAVLTADCLPLLLADGAGRVVAAVHCGWRGVYGDIAGRVVAELSERYAVEPADLHGHLGPGAASCCYEVSPELAGRFTERWGAGCVVEGAGPRPHLDLPGLVREQLVAAGMHGERIDGGGECTICGGRWFSHRRGDAGRITSAVWLPEG
jgi:hypothetical protein